MQQKKAKISNVEADALVLTASAFFYKRTAGEIRFRFIFLLSFALQ